MVTIRQNFDLSGHNTFRMKVSCACYVEYDSPKDLETIDFDSLPKPFLHMGGGSNLLFKGDFPGTVFHSLVKYIKYFDVGSDHVPVAVGAGVVWDDFVAKTCADGLWGAENLSLIPGEVGAAAVQNIGAYGVEAGDIIAGVTCFDTVDRKKVSFKTPECRYGYRDSIFKDPEVKGRYVITGVLFRLSRNAGPKLEYGNLKAAIAPCEGDITPAQVREAVIGVRRGKLPDPAETGSAGSFFKNPVLSGPQFAAICQGYETVPHYVLDGGFVKVPAAWMIEQCGFKGAEVGGAAVYEKQPLVIVNATGEASPQDVIALEEKIISGVREKFGVELHPEVEHV